jgi:hypothetical protein
MSTSDLSDSPGEHIVGLFLNDKLCLRLPHLDTETPKLEGGINEPILPSSHAPGGVFLGPKKREIKSVSTEVFGTTKVIDYSSHLCLAKNLA